MLGFASFIFFNFFNNLIFNKRFYLDNKYHIARQQKLKQGVTCYMLISAVQGITLN
jgi:hypothetical protein